MRVSQVALLLALSTSTIAAPINEKRWFPNNWWPQSANGNAIIDFIKRHPWPGMGPLPGLPMPGLAPPAPQQPIGQCNLANVELPQAPKPLPPPSAGLSIYHIAVGRGTQNYTCDTSNSTAVPKAVGAVADLFNATCLAANDMTMLSGMPPVALDFPVPSASDNPTGNPVYQDLSGHHYFISDTTPYFNLLTANANFGQGPFQKLNATAAPADAPVGQDGQGYGAAPWLKLSSRDASGCVFQEVFRVNTAGGNAPPTCSGMPAAFEVQYSAEYWFFSK